MNSKNQKGYNSKAKNYGQYDPPKVEWPSVEINWNNEIKSITVKDEEDKCYIYKCTSRKTKIYQSGLPFYKLDEIKQILIGKKLKGFIEYYPEDKLTGDDYKVVADYYYEKYNELKNKENK